MTTLALSETAQLAIVIGVVALAAVYLGWRMFAKSRKKSGGCETGCGKCDDK